MIWFFLGIVYYLNINLYSNSDCAFEYAGLWLGDAEVEVKSKKRIVSGSYFLMVNISSDTNGNYIYVEYKAKKKNDLMEDVRSGTVKFVPVRDIGGKYCYDLVWSDTGYFAGKPLLSISGPLSACCEGKKLNIERNINMKVKFEDEEKKDVLLFEIEYRHNYATLGSSGSGGGFSNVKGRLLKKIKGNEENRVKPVKDIRIDEKKPLDLREKEKL